MFLFTTPSTPPPAPPPPAGVPQTGGGTIEAIRKGAAATGTDFDYLLRTAKRESALDPTAKAPTSSATGLFQFIEQTWLGLVKTDGDRLGLQAEASAVSVRPDGTYTVADPGTRQAILKLREQPEVASLMAGALTQQNADALSGAIGRRPSSGELYMAHVLGARGAADLITTAGRDPSRAAASDFPEAARANRGIFYERSGRARSSSEVYAVLAAAQADGAAPAGTTAATGTFAAATSPAPPAVTVTQVQPRGLQGLFQTGDRAGPLSDAVARIWRTNNGGGARPADVRPFFPRSDGADPFEPEKNTADASASSAIALLAVASVDTGAAVDAAGTATTTLPLAGPLPPARPSSFTDPRAARRTAPLRSDQKARTP